MYVVPAARLECTKLVAAPFATTVPEEQLAAGLPEALKTSVYELAFRPLPASLKPPHERLICVPDATAESDPFDGGVWSSVIEALAAADTFPTESLYHA